MSVELPRLEARAKFFFEGERKFHVQGVTYGPFRPPQESEPPYPAPERAREDLRLMRELGVNVVRVYATPPGWFCDLCAEHGVRILMTIPWHKRILFLDDRETLETTYRQVRETVAANAGHPAIMGYLVDNEIPPDLVRWYGPRQIEVYLNTLARLVKEADPGALVSYANFPSTEYLTPQELDFYSFNVYLHEPKKLAAYLARLQNLAGNKPLMLSEFGMDTLRHTEDEQATLLAGHFETVFGHGLAGSIIFSWTDEWFTDGVEIEDWAFGIVTKERAPKAAYHHLQPVLASPERPLDERFPLPGGRPWPKVSVIVCSYNGARTLDDCLLSLSRLNYPDYEVILVDDGSTDETQEIAARFPRVRNLQQDNKGLSVARNVGIAAAGGEVIAFTDSDCMADADWLYYLVRTLESGDYAAVGGPNVSPPATNWVQATVEAAPGSPSHILLTDTTAEHVPGCNMAFHQWALAEIDGFDPEYRRAGDDVDVCWRLLQNGHQIAFSPAAVVWHYRRFTVGAYIGQQTGYGEAESLLRFKHLQYFGPTGSAIWKGRVYEQATQIPLLSRPVIYHGVFGTGLFQTLYPRPVSPWAGLISSVEWLAAALLILALSIPFEMLRLIPLLMLGLTMLVGLNYVARAYLEPRYDTLGTRLLLFYLATVQPWRRGLARYFTWLRGRRIPTAPDRPPTEDPKQVPGVFRAGSLAFWSEDGVERTALLNALREELDAEGWRYAVDTGWKNWDLHVFGSRWWSLRLRTMTEIYPHNRRLTRVGNHLCVSTLMFLVLAALVLLLAGGTALDPLVGSIIAGVGCLATVFWIYRGLRMRRRLATSIAAAAQKVGLILVTGKREKTVRQDAGVKSAASAETR
ncbi:MAG: glycosyltransferase [Verrucomicrobiota bacterium]